MFCPIRLHPRTESPFSSLVHPSPSLTTKVAAEDSRPLAYQESILLLPRLPCVFLVSSLSSKAMGRSTYTGFSPTTTLFTSACSLPGTGREMVSTIPMVYLEFLLCPDCVAIIIIECCACKQACKAELQFHSEAGRSSYLFSNSQLMVKCFHAQQNPEFHRPIIQATLSSSS